MSSFKKADGIIDSIQKQATGLRTLDGSAIEDFLSIAGYEDPQGGGGGDLTVTVQTLNIPQTTLTGEESDGWYEATVELEAMSSEIIDGIPYDDFNYYSIISDAPPTTIDGVDVTIDKDFDSGKFVLTASSSDPFTITYPATVVTYYRATKEVADTFGLNAPLYGGF